MTWYEDLYNRQIYFDLYAEEDTRLAVKQVDDLLKLLDVPPGASILDVCCGYGRHAIPLAGRGFRVTGIDLAQQQITEANTRAAQAGVEAAFILGNAREMSFAEPFDVSISVFVSFGFDDDEDNLELLRRISQATAPGGLLLMDLWNREREVRELTPLEIETRPGGVRVEKRREFDCWNGRLNWENTVLLPDGSAETWRQSMRLYTLEELRRMLDAVGFRLERVYGDLRGSRYAPDSPQMVTVSRKL